MTPATRKRVDAGGCLHDYGRMKSYIRKALRVSDKALAVWCNRCGKAKIVPLTPKQKGKVGR